MYETDYGKSVNAKKNDRTVLVSLILGFLGFVISVLFLTAYVNNIAVILGYLLMIIALLLILVVTFYKEKDVEKIEGLDKSQKRAEKEKAKKEKAEKDSAESEKAKKDSAEEDASDDYYDFEGEVTESYEELLDDELDLSEYDYDDVDPEIYEKIDEEEKESKKRKVKNKIDLDKRKR